MPLQDYKITICRFESLSREIHIQREDRQPGGLRIRGVWTDKTQIPLSKSPRAFSGTSTQNGRFLLPVLPSQPQSPKVNPPYPSPFTPLPYHDATYSTRTSQFPRELAEKESDKNPNYVCFFNASLNVRASPFLEV